MDTKIKFDLCIFCLVFFFFCLIFAGSYATQTVVCVLKAKCHICSLFIYLFFGQINMLKNKNQMDARKHTISMLYSFRI